MIYRAPLRISFFGGGTDNQSFVQRYGSGLVLGSAINVYVEVADDWTLTRPVPRGTGLGMSSAEAVCTIGAAACKSGAPLDPATLAWLAWESEHREHSSVGWQDAVFAAHGGLNLIEFRGGENIVHPVGRHRVEELESILLLVYTGRQRCSETLAARSIAAQPDNCNSLKYMRNQAREAEMWMNEKGRLLELLGNQLMHAWMHKKYLAEGIDTPEIDAAYVRGRHAGAWGGKLLGAGGGGYLLFVVAPEDRERVKAAVGLPELPIRLNAPGFAPVDPDGTICPECGEAVCECCPEPVPTTMHKR